MKQLLLLLIITMATLTANAQAKIYDAYNLKARTTIQLGNKTITDFTDDTVMANKYQSKIMSEWATKKAIENALQGLGVDTNVLATRLRLYKVKDSLSAIMNTKLAITDTANKWVSKSHTINNISNGTGFLKNNGSGSWSWDNNSYIIGSGAANQIPYFVSGSVTGSNSNFKYTSELLLSQANSTQTYSVINASNTFNNLGIRQGQNGLATLFGYQFGNNASNASDYGNLLSLNGFYDGTQWFTKNGYVVPSMLMLRGNGGLSIFTNNISQAGVAGNFTPTETMTILGNGNVGINQTNPSIYKLDVTGTGRFTSNVTANSFIKSSGTASQFLKADGSVDGSTYLTTSSAASTYLAKTDTTNKWIPKTHTTNNIANGTGFLKNNGSGTWSYDNTNYTPKPKIVKYDSSTYTLSGDENYVFAENGAGITLPLLSDVANGYIIEFGLINTSLIGDQYEVICNGSDVFDVPLNCTNLYVQTAGGALGSVSVLSTKIMADKDNGKWLVLQATKMGCY